MNVFNDLKFSFRLSLRNLNSSLLAIIVMTLGIGIAVIMYTIGSAVEEDSSGVKLDDDVVYVQWIRSKDERRGSNLAVNVRDFRVFRSEVTSLENMAGIHSSRPSFVNPANEPSAKRYRALSATSNLFDLVEAKPLKGRLFQMEDTRPGAEKVVIISEQIWEDQYERSDEAIGSTALINGNPRVIVGIMPKEFAFPPGRKMWMPSAWTESDTLERNKAPRIGVIGTRKKEYTEEQVQTELNAIAARLSQEFPKTNENRTRVSVAPYNERFTSGAPIPLIVMTAGSLLVLLVTCANVFNVIMVRTASRSSELAARCSLGATRRQVIWQVLIDGLMLASAGAAMGLLVAHFCLRWATAYFKRFDLPESISFSMGWDVILYIIVAVIFTGFISSIIPAMRASKMDVFSLIKDDTRSSASIFIGWLSKILIVSQIALSGMLLFGTVTMVHASMIWDDLDMPYDESSVLTASIHMVGNQAFTDPHDISRFFEDYQRRMESEPGVEAVAFSSAEFGLLGNPTVFDIEGKEENPELSTNVAQYSKVTPGYGDIFEVAPMWGRMFNNLDTKDSMKVCIVNKPFVNAYFNRENPVGKRIRVKDQGNQKNEWLHIVGVIPATLPEIVGASDQALAAVHVPFSQSPDRRMAILLRGRGQASQYIQPMMKTARELSPTTPIEGTIRTIEERLDFVRHAMRLIATLTFVFGFAILAKSVIGLYAVIAFATKQRYKEFGIRIALGAKSARIVLAALKPWLWQVGIGLIFGLAAALGLSFAMEYIARATNQAESESAIYTGIYMLVVVGIVSLASLVAMAIPTWRSTRLNPINAIREA